MAALTRGYPLSWTSLLSSIRPGDQVFTGIHENSAGERSFIGQICQSPRLPNAQLNYFITPEGAERRELTLLLEGLIREAGLWGTTQVLAELTTDSEFFPEFRQAGFSVLAKQHLYRFDNPGEIQSDLEGRWRIWNSDDIPAMRRLYLTLVPPLIQPVEPLTRLERLGLVYYEPSGGLQAFADLVYGPVGIWILPFVHPQSAVDPACLLRQILADLSDLAGRPVYVVARSYQPWVETALEHLEGLCGQEQILMVRHLAIRQRIKADLAFKPLDNGNTEPSIPIATAKSNGK